jgi:hypothetical protein
MDDDHELSLSSDNDSPAVQYGGVMVPAAICPDYLILQSKNHYLLHLAFEHASNLEFHLFPYKLMQQSNANPIVYRREDGKSFDTIESMFGRRAENR